MYVICPPDFHLIKRDWKQPMSKRTEADFQKFQKVFTKYQHEFGMTGYKVYFKHEPIEDAYASIYVNHDDHVATVRLDSSCLPEDNKLRNVEASAKHEAIHLLISKLEYLATSRYCREDEIYQEVESIAHKLESLIP